MPVSQVLNPKGVIKRQTNNDLPFSPQQPVISSFYATSTAGQTVINLSFSVDTANSDIFWLFVDGKKLDLGSGNDYTFTAVGADGTSSQVTLNQAIPVNLNIQAYKLGLKKESEFLTDNRFVQLYAAQLAGFQGFINPTDAVMTATAVTGTPAAGTFYSTITNRASIADLSQDLKARMGVERLAFLTCFPLQNEFGPNGEAVSAAPNDTFGQVRFVGQWTTAIANSGVYVFTTTANDFIEVVFYGTGLNILEASDGTARDYRVAIDGGSESANLFATHNGVLTTRNTTTNQIRTITSGLALGVHTAKIRLVSGTALSLCGIETLNVSSNVTVNPGTGYSQAKKYSSSAQSVFAFNSVATGTRGGRVLVYQNGDGSIGKAWQPTNAASALLTSADHTNEEVARTHYPREFGAGRADDFSRIGSGAQVAAFTLDDNTTTLSATSCLFQTLNGVEGVAFGATSNSFVFTFVGTGLDIQVSVGTLVGATFTYAIDGSAAAAISFTNGQISTVKIVSGLPYGSHTFKLTLSAITSGSFNINKFLIYQPKKPLLPSGTVEIADYNVMANFSTAALTDNTINGALILAQGTLFKSIAREFLYTGANWTLQAATSWPSGWDATTLLNNNQPASYTFFGTGAVLSVENSTSGTFSVSVTVDGSLFSTATALQNMSNGGGGTYTTTTSTGLLPGRIAISGLAMGVHTVVIQRTAGTGNFFFPDIQLVTPIHSYKSNFYADLQNTLPIGSQGISDNRPLSPIKNSVPVTKAFAQVIGIQGGSTNSSALVPAPDMSLTIKTSGGPLDISYSIFPTWSNVTASMNFQLFVDGVAQGQFRSVVSGTSGGVIFCVTDRLILPVSAGTHHIEVYYSVTGGTNTLESYKTLVAREL